MNRKMELYRSWLASEKGRLIASIRLMEQEERIDEANWDKIRLNIIEAFETIAGADERFAINQQRDPWELFCQRYLPRFTAMSAKWQAQLETARLHGDTSAEAVETIKIETASRIEAAFRSAGEKSDE